MKDHIDDIVKKSLENLEVPYDSASWDSMQQRIDQELSEDFDHEIKSAIGNLSEPYQHKNWLQLREWLDYSWYATNKIYVNKTTECALMLLSLFTFFNYSAHHATPTLISEQEISEFKNDIPDHSDSKTIMASKTEDHLTSDLELNRDALHQSFSEVQEVSPSIVEPGNNALKHNSNEFNNEVPASKSILVKEFLPKNDQSKQLEMEPTAPVASTSTKERTEFTFSDDLDNKQVTLFTDYDEKETENVITNQLLVDDSSIQKDDEFLFEPQEAIATLDLVAIKLLNGSSANELQAQSHPTISKTRNPYDKKWAISAFADLNFNHITTPYDELYLKSGYNQNRVGYGGGLMAHRELGPIELSAGVGYSSKKYSPKQFIELFKRSEDSEGTEYRFEGVKLNVLTVPIHAAYFISKKGKWRPYVTLGGALHLALQAEYEKEDRPVSRFESVPQYLDENEGATYTVGVTPNFEKKKFPDGLLENGSFRDNHYFTLDMGIGVERMLSPSTSVFLQPTVYYNLFNKGLSANNDKINTFALQMGVKTKI